jgi:hypothetical protein
LAGPTRCRRVAWLSCYLPNCHRRLSATGVVAV